MLFLVSGPLLLPLHPVNKLSVPFTGCLKGPECSRSLCADSIKRNKLGYEKGLQNTMAGEAYACREQKKKVLFVCFVLSVKIPFLRPLYQPVDVQGNGMRKLGRNGSVGEGAYCQV